MIFITSTLWNADVRVAEDRILGPLVFILYVNHLVTASKVLETLPLCIRYMCNINFNEPGSVIDTFDVELQIVVEWFKNSHLILKQTKCNFEIFLRDKKKFRKVKINWLLTVT